MVKGHGIDRLVVVGDKSYAPFEFLDAQGRPGGIFYDLWQLWSKKTGVRVDYQLMNWSDAMAAVRQGRADLVGGMFYSARRDKVFDFSKPYLEIETVVFFHKNILGIEKLADLQGFHVGVVKGDYAQEYLQEHLPGASLAVYLNNTDLIEGALQGEVRVFVCDLPVALFWLARDKRGRDFHYLSPPLYTSKVHAAVREGRSDLLSLVNSGLDAISPGEMKDLLKKCTGRSIFPGLWSILVPYFLAAGFVCILAVVWVCVLRSRLRTVSRELEEKNRELLVLARRMQGVIENTDIGFFVRNLDGVILEANDKFASLLGYPLSEIIGRKLSTWIDSDDLSHLERAMGQVHTRGALKHNVLRFRRADGQVIFVEGNATLLREQQDGDVVVVLCQDVSWRIKLQADLEEERERLHVTLSSIGDAVIATDEEGRVALLNRVAAQLTGWTEQEALGMPMEEILPLFSEKTGEPVDSPVRKVLEQGTIIGLANHTQLRTRDGKFIPIADSGAPIRDKQGRVLGVVMVFRDVREERRREEEQLKTQKLESIGLLAGGLAHDFNNLLGALMVNLSLIKSSPRSCQDFGRRIEKIERVLSRAQELTQQLLTFAKGGEPIKKTFYLHELLQDLVPFILSGSGVQANFSFPDQPWAVVGDQGQLSQVVTNLVVNARQAMPTGGILDVQLDNIELDRDLARSLSLVPGHYLKLTFKDQGQGIAPEYLDKIFDPYFTTKQNGSGLGLATVYSIVQRHQGNIVADSVLGEGTVFTLYLPADPEWQSRDRELEDMSSAGPARILVMDDQQMVLESVEDALHSLGCQVVTARNGEQAISLYRDHLQRGEKIDLVILDLVVAGGQGGKETIKRLRELDPEVKAVVSSGYSDDQIMSRYRDFGFQGVLKKPYSVQDLSRMLAMVLQDPE